ncbi:hypothetical protein HH214_12905 [Mucilaginibacter robiniae]|uniref:Adhesin domain-containing protein n=1 Tax=Mucilaginibacter robiniae TaxID=2728022 RepID=A0A7L5E8L0_9SPHI|nr:hypothetical protein [Mucilaginibacter robiniae]QJD96706.1 hypothetical protein HH214_12905 [Mucilaginibacter robiniae]
MKLKIFNLTLYMMCAFMLLSLPSFAQTNSAKDTTDYRQQMHQLREQMRTLQHQMSRLQMQELRKQTQVLRKQSQSLYIVPGQQFDLGTLNSLKLNSQKLTDSIINTLKLNDSSLNLKSLTSTLNNRIYARIAPMSRLSGTMNMGHNESEAELRKQVQSGDVKEKIKTYSKSYPVSNNDTIQIKNSYGKVSVNTWNKSEVKVEVEIKAYANEEADAQNLLNNIIINDSKKNAVVAFKTDIDIPKSVNKNGNILGTWFNSGKRYTRKMIINYTVYMPAKSHLNINNTFGSIVLPELLGKVNIILSNGSLISQPLVNPENRYNISFSDGNIAAVNGGKLNVSYSRVNVGTADKLKATSNFSTLNVDKLKSWGDVAVRYGEGFKVNELDKNLKNLNVNAAFTKLAITPGDNVDFDITTHLGNFNYDTTDVKLTSGLPTSNERGSLSTRTYKGKIGKGNINKVINIKSSFTNVKFN